MMKTLCLWHSNKVCLDLLDICMSINKRHSRTKEQVRLKKNVILRISIVVGGICFVETRDFVLLHKIPFGQKPSDSVLHGSRTAKLIFALRRAPSRLGWKNTNRETDISLRKFVIPSSDKRWLIPAFTASTRTPVELLDRLVGFCEIGTVEEAVVRHCLDEVYC